MEQVQFNGKVIDIISVSSTSASTATATATSPFEILRTILSQTSVVGFDAEWKPQKKTSQPKTSAVGLDAGGKRQKTEFPHVCILQIACLPNAGNPVVFLVDLWQLQFNPDSVSKFHELLRHLFESQEILKLGFDFEQDFKYISYTFQSHFKLQGFSSGFDRVSPLLDISKHFSGKEPQSMQPKLIDVCLEVLRIRLSKDEQCSDWSDRPLTKNQKDYAAIDAYCLIEIFNVVLDEFFTKGGLSYAFAEPRLPLLESSLKTIPMDDNLFLFVKECCNDEITLIESDRNSQKSKKKNKGSKQKNKGESSAQPISKFVCATKVVGLARLLRVAGIDTKVACSREGYESSDIEDVLKQAQKEGRVLLTLESKMKKHNFPNYYRLRKPLAKDQLPEVLEKFKLLKNMDQMSRCTKCNKGFKLSRPRTLEEEIEAATGYGGWCMNCRDCYERYLYGNNKGKQWLDYLSMCNNGYEC